jgi:hypothetical protein
MIRLLVTPVLDNMRYPKLRKTEEIKLEAVLRLISNI